MSFIGNSFTNQTYVPKVDYFNGDGSTTQFTLSRNVASVADIQSVIENVPQNPASAFTVSGNVITFTSAPPSGTNNIYVRYTTPTTNLVKPAPGTVDASSILDLAITNAKIANATITLSKLSATGTPASNTYLRGDNTWASIASSQWTTTGSDIYYTTGNVGVGTSSPDYKFQIEGVGTGVTSRMGITNTTTGSTLEVGSDGNGGFLSTSGAFNTLFYNNGSEQMRITKDGDFLMAPGYRTEPRGKVDISAVGGTVSGLPSVCLAMSRWGDAGVMVNFFPNHGSTTSIGNIYNAGLTNTQYNTSSDYRLKENIAPMTGALSKVALLKPCTYTWKSTGAAGQGFIAHELDEVVPDAVCGEKDAVDSDGNIVSQGIDTSYLVATLTAAIQEQQAIIEELKSRIEVLEAK